jgi:ATP-binding protein involved in chromosome partitioning
MAIDSEAILQALRQIQEPSSQKNLVDANAIHHISVSGTRVSFQLKLPPSATKFQNQLEKACKEAVLAVKGVQEVDLKVLSPNPPSKNPIPCVKNTIAVAAGKGGVGKSTIACNLAVGLAKRGYSVGLMDTDVFGPSIPMMMGVTRQPEIQDNKLVPLQAHGVKLMSIGFLIDEKKPVIWRGPMVNGAIQQFFRDVLWGELDYLIIDLPPGTGDAQLTLVQTISLTGALIVCTPQDVALADAKKALNMFRETHVYVLGMIENMSYFRPPNAPDSQVYHIFGKGGVEKVAKAVNVSYLGDLPLVSEIPQGGDQGIPFLAGKDNEYTPVFYRILDRVLEEVEKRNSTPTPTLSGIISS